MLPDGTSPRCPLFVASAVVGAVGSKGVVLHNPVPARHCGRGLSRQGRWWFLLVGGNGVGNGVVRETMHLGTEPHRMGTTAAVQGLRET